MSAARIGQEAPAGLMGLLGTTAMPGTADPRSTDALGKGSFGALLDQAATEQAATLQPLTGEALPAPVAEQPGQETKDNSGNNAKETLPPTSANDLMLAIGWLIAPIMNE